MRHIRGALLALAVAACPAALQAQVPAPGPPAGARPQAPSGVIRGAVLDAATGSPVPSASVGVWSAADSALVTGAVAGPDGVFRIEGLRPGAYYLRVGALGHAAATPRVALTPQAPQADLGQIRLAASAVALEGLEVPAERSAVALRRTATTTRPATWGPRRAEPPRTCCAASPPWRWTARAS